MPRGKETPPVAGERRGRYHHGDLRAALLAAAEAELAERGVEKFSLRGVAKRAGVSHAAPAHHFGDANGLLTALAAEGFRRFVGVQRARQRRAAPDGADQLIAAGLGYIDFATTSPALFRLMFSSDRPQHGDPELALAAGAAFQQLVDDVARARGVGAPPMLDVMSTWAIAHGLADLLNAGRMRHLLDMPPERREAAVTEILRRAYATKAAQSESPK